MGDLGADTAIERVGDGRYRASLSKEWEIWGPMGGYVAAVALRAAGAHAGIGRPASFFCHFLSVAAFDDVDVEAVTLRAGRRTASVRVSVSQSGKPVLEAMAWAAEESDGMEHAFAPAPDVPDPGTLPNVEERMAGVEGAGPPFPFWNNMEERPPVWIPWDQWDPQAERDPVWDTWFRLRPAAAFAEDPWLDACRLLIVLDIMQWPAASRGHGDNSWMAPSLDLFAAFHRPSAYSPWLLGHADSPAAGQGLVGGRAAVWGQDRTLLATGGQQMLCRPAPPRSAT